MLPTWRAQRQKGKLFDDFKPFYLIYLILIANFFPIFIFLFVWSLQSAIFAIGNSVYHNDVLFSNVEDVLIILVQLLNDSLAKTRIHSTGKIAGVVDWKKNDQKKVLSLYFIKSFSFLIVF